MSVNDVDLSRLDDGSYTGSFRGARWSNTLEVTIKDHKITEIDII